MRRIVSFALLSGLLFGASFSKVEATEGCIEQAWVCMVTDDTCKTTTVEFEDGSSISVIISGKRPGFKWPCP